MANGKIRFGKQSGGELALVIPDGVADTEVIVPESGTLVSVGTTVTDNAIVRFDGVTGAVQNSSVTITDNGTLVLTSGTGVLGYGIGSGGTVTQLTSKSTAVTLNKPSGQITMNNAALTAGASVTFTLNNSLLSAHDTLCMSMEWSLTTSYRFEQAAIGVGSTFIRVTNISGSSLSEALQIKFNVIKGANS